MASVVAKPQQNLRSLHKKVDLKHSTSKNWLIHMHFVRREFQACKSVINEELLRLNGYSEYANYTMALILRSEGRIQESLDRLQMCHELEPTNANTVIQIARSLFLLGRHKLAVDAYKKAQLLNEEPDAEMQYNIGMCHLFMKDLDKAKEHMQLSLQTRVSHDAFEMLAVIAMTMENVPEAISVYEKALRILPENVALLRSLGVLLMKLNRNDLAFAKLRAALAHDSVNAKAVVAMASMMQMHEDYDFALAKYKTAMQMLPDSSSVWNNVGMCFFGKRKFVAAVSCLKRACYLSPFDWKILYNLGLVHLCMQQYASAFHFLTAAINLQPNQSQTFALLAVAISHLEETEHSALAFDQAIRLDQTGDERLLHLLYLNYAISMFNYKSFAEAKSKLALAEKSMSNSPYPIDPEAAETVSRMKRMLNQNPTAAPRVAPDREPSQSQPTDDDEV